ncbi:phage tail protein [Actinomycetospora termitidis]|uniref:Uncharacterized protein n=1 Tax=Actinomycetospora termitidis TaxID=3053470 RepID=A0ABT7M7E7_9PSEU|nr:hypothetical protein [Actinomycetospora sp. Odt1-22]MDL5156575.1 hypothetical protein [Actinomycetospora sp. Odt1-22]
MTTTRARHPEPERRPQPAALSAAPPRTAPQTVLRWQATAGNAAVAGLLARGGGSAPVVAQRDEEDGDSWWSRGIAAAKAAWRMKDQLSGVLGRGAGVVGSIVRSPVAFLGNLVAGVKGGILRFRANIGEHLKRGLMGWLLGALAEGGVQIPATFDAKGIVSMLASLFGLTWNAIRTRVVTRIGEGAMSAVEKGVEVFRLLSGQGVAGLWQMLLARLGNLQEMLLGQVREFVISRVLTAGVTWLIGILNPAAGIIKALKLIYDIVVFFRENAARLTKLVETVLDSISDVARGSVGAVVSKVESVLGGMVPTLIGFLASVLGLRGIGQRIRAIVERMQKPVRGALDHVIGMGLRLAGPLIKRFNRMRAAAEAKVESGTAWVRGKAEAGKKRLKSKLYGGDDSTQGRQQRLEKGLGAGLAVANRFANRKVGVQVLAPLLKVVRLRFGLSVVEPRRDGQRWAIHAEVQRAQELKSKAMVDGLDEKEKEARKYIGREILAKHYDGKLYSAVVAGVGPISVGSPELVVTVRFVDSTSPRGSRYAGSGVTRLLPINAFLADVAVGRDEGVAILRSGGEHKSKYAQLVTSGGKVKYILHKAFRLGWRSRFYPTTYSKRVEDYRDKFVADRIRPEDRAKPYEQRRWMYGGKSYPVADRTVDHDPAVVVHFKTRGLNMKHEDRVEWYEKGGDRESPEIMPRSENSKKGSGSEKDRLGGDVEMGPDFRGRDED